MTKQRQELPLTERELLRALSGADLKFRARRLHEEGWSLASIANAFIPPKQRSSVRAWVVANVPAPPTAHTLPPLPSSSSASSSFIAAAEKVNFESPVVAAAARLRPKRRTFDERRPALTPAEKRRISYLAPLARRHRARTSPNSTYARANRELTELCATLYVRGASVRELSLAAGVTYRAMARRLRR